MASISPYLTFLGNCEDAFNHYKSVFGGEFPYVGRFGDMPPQEGKEMPDEAKNLIMHISLPIGDTTLMGSDTGGEWASNTVIGNNMSVSVNADSKEHADQIYGGLAEGGNPTMPMENTFWGSYFGMCTDKFGINWMVSWDDPNNQSQV